MTCEPRQGIIQLAQALLQKVALSWINAMETTTVLS